VSTGDQSSLAAANNNYRRFGGAYNPVFRINPRNIITNRYGIISQNTHPEVPRGFAQSLQKNAEIVSRLGYHPLIRRFDYTLFSVDIT